jgi:hypothetical protein
MPMSKPNVANAPPPPCPRGKRLTIVTVWPPWQTIVTGAGGGCHATKCTSLGRGGGSPCPNDPGVPRWGKSGWTVCAGSGGGGGSG